MNDEKFSLKEKLMFCLALLIIVIGIFFWQFLKNYNTHNEENEKEISLKYNQKISTEKANVTKSNEPIFREEGAQQAYSYLLSACPGLIKYKKDVSRKYNGKSEPYDFMIEDYGWQDNFHEFLIFISKQMKSIPANFNAMGHTCSFRVHNQEVDVIKNPCASVCLGEKIAEQDHNYLIVNGKSVIRW